MTLIDGLLILAGIILIYAIIVYILHARGILKKYNITFWGPALMLRTEKGIGFLKRLAKHKRFWKTFGNIGIAVTLILMVVMVVLFVYNVSYFLTTELAPEQQEVLDKLGPEMAFVLPGLNPILPFEYIFYIIFALVVAMVVHEFSHGILSIVGKIKVKSLGLLYLIIPLGAFCEPDEEQLKETKRIRRMRVFVAGPMSNLVVAIICIFLFSFVFMSSVQPVDGVHVIMVYDDTPADEISLSEGSVITSLNDSKIKDSGDFHEIINHTHPTQTVNISYYRDGTTYYKQVQLTNKYDFYLNYLEDESDKDELNESLKNDSFLGFVQNTNDVSSILGYLQNPFSEDFPLSLLYLYSLPIFGYITGYNPIAEPFTNSYIIQGPLASIPEPVFWGIVTALFWMLWLNLAVGIFNILPIVPMDGGYIFNDALNSLVQRIKGDISKEKREKIVNRITIALSLFVLFLVLFPFFFKYVF
jgi:membrane-associated protease RseP (regulator of RpoE activity)